MIDFPEVSDVAQKSDYVFEGVVYFLMLFGFRKAALSLDIYPAIDFPRRWLFWLLSLILVIYHPTAGDFAHYQDLVLNYHGQKEYHLEDIYRWIIDLTDNNYLLFRIIVWGGGVVLLFNSFKWYGLSAYYPFFLFITVYFGAFAYARAGVALAAYCLGVGILFSDAEVKKVIKIAVGLGLIYLSYCLHHSLIVVIALTPLAFLPLNRTTMLFVAFGVAILSIAFSSILERASEFILGSEELGHRVGSYLKTRGSVTDGHSLSGSITILWSKLTIHVPFWVCVYYMLKDDNQYILPINVQSLFRISFVLYIYVVFMLISLGSANGLYYRYEGLLYIPITVILASLRQNELLPYHVFTRVYWFCAASLIYGYAYWFIFK